MSDEQKDAIREMFHRVNASSILGQPVEWSIDDGIRVFDYQIHWNYDQTAPDKAFRGSQIDYLAITRAVTQEAPANDL